MASHKHAVHHRCQLLVLVILSKFWNVHTLVSQPRYHNVAVPLEMLRKLWGWVRRSHLGCKPLAWIEMCHFELKKSCIYIFWEALHFINLAQWNQLITQMKMIKAQCTTRSPVIHCFLTEKICGWNVKLFAVAKWIELRIEFIFSNFQKRFFFRNHDDGLLNGLHRLGDGDDFLLLVRLLLLLMIVRIVLLVSKLLVVVIVMMVVIMMDGLMVELLLWREERLFNDHLLLAKNWLLNHNLLSTKNWLLNHNLLLSVIWGLDNEFLLTEKGLLDDHFLLAVKWIWNDNFLLTKQWPFNYDFGLDAKQRLFHN